MAPIHAVTAVGSDMAAMSSQMAPIWLAMSTFLPRPITSRCKPSLASLTDSRRCSRS